MAKSLLKIKARELRREGSSIGKIAKEISVSKSTASLWCRDIALTNEQIKNLLNNKKEGVKKGQIIAALNRKKKRLEIIKNYEKEGTKRFRYLSKKEIFVAGLVLYLAEGSKKEKFVKFINSDPEVLEFMLSWFKNIFNITDDRFKFTVFINELHKEREEMVKKFWSQRLKIPLHNFRKTVFIKSKQKKIYENYDSHYGTMNFTILKSVDLMYKILGLIKGLLKQDISQGSSVGKSAALIKRRSRVQLSPLTLT